MMNKNEIDIIYDKLVKSGKRFDFFKFESKYWIKRRERFKLKHILKGHPAKAIKRARWYKSTQEMRYTGPKCSL